MKKRTYVAASFFAPSRSAGIVLNIPSVWADTHRRICLQLCTRIRKICTSIYAVCARTYNYGKTFCKNDDPAADGGIFVSFTDLKANCKRNSMLLEAVLAEDSLLQYNKSWKSVDL